MYEMKALKCTCCGGNINRATMTCEYCGTQYTLKDDNLLRIETFTNPIKTIGAEMVIHKEDLLRAGETSKVMEFCVKRLAAQMAEQLYDCMQIRTADLWEYNSVKLRAQAKVVVPIMGVEDLKETFKSM